MKRINNLLLGTLIISLFACSSTGTQNAGGEKESLSDFQAQLIEDGWALPRVQPEGELPKAYGVKSKYGLQDNYFDIKIGPGCNVAIKIMDAQSDKCIRYVYVPENTSITINQVPQGMYYLKLAYGQDWMEHIDGNQIVGKFTRNVVYEKSVDVFDFGKKNSDQLVNYTLSINIVDSHLENNFKTYDISEEDFLN
jgi:hypothetical protein